ncbi:MAG: nucleotide exchange factor GrpE [Ignavibacteriales bacterium]|nr:nucleotide exchange factor GrpE [Ignavibacteriales bacterium]
MEEKNLEHNETQQPNEQEQPSHADQSAPVQKSELELLSDKISDAEKQAAMYKDQLLRKAAEFDNYKRRTEADALSIAKFAGENIIAQLIPILDDLSRSLKSRKDLPADDRAGKLDSDPFYKGVELIYAKFMKVLESQGLKAMETVGKEFNVEYHDALMLVPKSDVPPHTIIEEIEKGYMLFDKIIRHAKVIVSSPVEEEVKN